MCKIKINATVFLIILQIFLVAAADFEETCESDQRMEEQCLNQTYKVVKPLLDHLNQVKNELKESEIEEKKLKELNVKIHEKSMREAALLDEYKNKVMKGEIDLQSCQIKVDKLESEINSLQNIILKLKGELSDKSTNLENCELQFKNLNSTIIENIQNNTKYQKTLELNLEKSKSKLIKQDKDIQLCQSEIDTLNRTSENIREQQKKIELQFKDSQTKLLDKVKENQQCRAEVDTLNKSLPNTIIPSSCSPFGDYPGVHEIRVSGVGFFDVLCDSQLAGPGWIVIQQRVGGKENFNRDWATYRKGFGSYNSDFFLGLDKMHRITSLQRSELYIHLVAVNGTVYFARYDDFKISNEDNGYKLSLGKFKGNVNDAMRYVDNMKFSTFDRDNDNYKNNCAEYYKSGWWYNACFYCNLNKEYLIHQTIDLKEIKMLVRPKQ